jgi:N-acetyl-gamma-glutamyl-phosphate reductase
MKPKIFIDGREGTTGLQIYERLNNRDDIELIKIEETRRKDIAERKKLITSADLVFLCLPDNAACESVSLIENDKTRVIDASTAHRVAEDWIYGLPELSGEHRQSIRAAKRVSNPGCHSTGAILLLAPLVKAGVLPKDYPFVITSVTGYTGGGKKMIEEYETSDRENRSDLDAPRLYSTGAEHKHIPEIKKYSGLVRPPVLTPIVADYPQGLQVIIPLHLPDKRGEAFEVLSTHYLNCANISVFDAGQAFSASNVNSGQDKVTLSVLGFDDKIILTAQLDNLGKGAAGAAVQNMNIMLGLSEYSGLTFN